VTGTPELVNWIPTLHYEVDESGRSLLDTFLPPEASAAVQGVDWDLWLAEDGGWPAQIRASFAIRGKSELLSGLGLRSPATWTLLITITTPNDPELAIYPPREENLQNP
jgi:hypothetical protein